MPFWRIWRRERVQFNDGNIGRQTIDSVDLVPDKPDPPRDIFVGPLAMGFGFGIFDEHVLGTPLLIVLNNWTPSSRTLLPLSGMLCQLLHSQFLRTLS